MIRRLVAALYGLYALLAFGAVIFLLAGPLIVAGPTLRLRRSVFRLGVKAALAVTGVPFRVQGLEHLPDEPCVMVANHASYLDGLVLGAALPPRFTFMVHDGARRWPYVGLGIRRLGAAFVSRTEARDASRQTRELARRLVRGESLAVFPEGGFRTAPGLRAFRDGAFVLAALAHVPVVPAAISGTRRMLGEGAVLPRHGRIQVRLLPALAPHAHGRAEALRLRDAARTAILAQCGEPDDGAEK